MGRHFITSLANVHLDDSVGVDGEALVRVDSHAEETGVGLLLFGSCFKKGKLIRITNSLATVFLPHTHSVLEEKQFLWKYYRYKSILFSFTRKK